MQRIYKRFRYLFLSTKGLILVAVAMISLVSAVFGMLSGPMAELGISEKIVNLFNMKLIAAEREGRIVILYHVIANAVIAIEVYIINAMLNIKDKQRGSINATVTIGYLTAMIFGLWFAYFGHNYIFHGLFIFGECLMYFGGILFAAALWPWKKENYIDSKEHSRTKKGIDLERVAFFVMAVATLGSVLFGAIPGSLTGNGFETFLAENTIRMPNKNVLDLAVIGHLHIMLTQIAIACALIVGKWVNFRGLLHKISMPLMIIGTIIITFGVWMVVPFQFIAHMIIYVGSTLILVVGLLLLIFNWNQLIKDRIKEQGIVKANIFQKFKALFHDPLKFGATWQMLYMNFTTSFIGIFFAVKLDEIIRKWPAREERIELAGHWHILATIIATILLFYIADLFGLKGKTRKWFGWLVIISSNLAFGAAVIFFMKRIFISEAAQQPLVDTVMILIEIGLGSLLIVLGIFMGWRLLDLFKKGGRWSNELEEYNTEVKQ